MGVLEPARDQEEAMMDPPNSQISELQAQDFLQNQTRQEQLTPQKIPSRKWFKQWVPQETVLNSGKCYLSKWVTEDNLKALEEKFQVVEQVPEPDFEVVFLCSYEGCGRIFTEAGALRKHSQVHQEKQFICNYEGCGRKCLDASKLKRHLLIHTGEKQFVCPIEGCGKAFSLDFNLRSHMRTHSQENYHICPFEECGKRYAHESKLKAHMRSQHEKILPFDVKLTPPPVERESANPRIVTPTSASATLDRPFACPYEGCGKRYKHEYKLNLHLRREHAGPTYEENGRHGRTSDAEDEMDDGSEQDEDVGKVGIINGSGRGKLRIISKPSPGTSMKRKRSNAASVDLNIKVNARASVGRNGLGKDDFEEDSEETEEDHEDTEDEGWGNRMNIEMEDDDDEETEDDMS
eukprot:Gb_19862 [translate_table: standard]